MVLDLLITHPSEIFTGADDPAELVGIKDGHVVALNATDMTQHSVGQDTITINAQDKLVTPGWVECHTHLVFAGDRSGEYAMRAAGANYVEIAQAGGGILHTMRSTRAADFDTLLALARPRMDALLRQGVTTVEIKSGYGLDLATELKILRVARALGESHPIDVITTFLGAHTIPPEYKKNRAGYVRHVIEDMLPAVAAEGLADFCDVFVETIGFTLSEAEAIFRAAQALRMPAKLHADQLTAGGGAELAGRLNAASADHLEHISDKGITAMAQAGTVAVLLPGAGVFLGDDTRPPARRLIDAGVPVALSTDCNPGTCMTENLHLMLTLGMSRLGMSPTEVLLAVTRNAAQALRRSDAGRLFIGGPADVAIFSVPNRSALPYHFATDHTHTVIKNGQIVYSK